VGEVVWLELFKVVVVVTIFVSIVTDLNFVEHGVVGLA